MKRLRLLLYFVVMSALLAFLALDSLEPRVLLVVVLIGLVQGFLLWRYDDKKSPKRPDSA